MKYLFTVCALATFVLGQSQNKLDTTLYIKDYERAESSMSNATTWSLYYQFQKEEYKPSTTIDAINKLALYVANNENKNSHKIWVEQHRLIKKYHNMIDTMLRSILLFGGGNIPLYFFRETPVEFGLHRDNKLSMIISSASSKNVYNTLTTTHRQRVAKITQEISIETLTNFAKTINYSEIKYLGISVIYGSNDFSDKSGLSVKPEVVCVICEMNKLRKYNSKDITEDELVDSCEIYASSRDMVTKMKKIKITLE